MRVVTVFDTQTSGKRPHNSNATNWGQLRRELGVDSNMKAVLREGRQTLENNEAVLPTGDFTIFLFPNKVKSGLDKERLKADIRELKNDITDAFNDLIADIDSGEYGEGSSSSDDDELAEEAARIASGS